jgi:hypothetical protein
VVSLLLGEVVSILKKHIVAKDVVCLLLGEVPSKHEKENTSSQRMWLAYK